MPRLCDSFRVLDDISGEVRVRAKMMNAAIRQRQRKVTALEFVVMRFDFFLSFLASGKVCATIDHVFLAVSVETFIRGNGRIDIAFCLWTCFLPGFPFVGLQ